MEQGRAGLVAFRRYHGAGGTNALGRPFYKGGFEPRMNRREATLILELSYVHAFHLTRVCKREADNKIIAENEP